jgi:prepilin-type processing-associated H-X9-DG protein
LLVVIAIIGILVALLLPAIQAAREAARRTQCLDHQKNLGLALQNYHDTYKVFPMGAMIAGGPKAPTRTQPGVMGPSWWYGILPFIEQRNIYDKIANTQRSGVTARIFCAGDLDPNIAGAPIKDLVPEFMRCPSTPLLAMETQAGPIALPTYVGIAGGCDITMSANPSPDYTGIPANMQPNSNRVYVNQNKGSLTTPNGQTAIVCSSGMLPPAQHINMAGCSDGTSNTAIVGEQSDWLRDTDRTISTKYHGDPGWNDGTYTPTAQAPQNTTPPTAAAGGWVSGTEDATIQVGKATSITATGSAPGAWTVTSLFNITTVRYKPDLKEVMGTGLLPGCDQTMGHNNPLQSPHPGGMLVAFVDGSVQFISGTQDFAVLLRIAIRDDGQNVSLDN